MKSTASALLLFALALVACQESSDSHSPHSNQAITAPLKSAESVFRLAPPRQWQRVNPEDTFRATPRWSPDGANLTYRGRSGRGLYLNSRDGGELVIDSTYRGPYTWRLDNRSICAAHGEGGAVIELKSVGKTKGLRMSGACDVRHLDEIAGQLVFAGEHRIYHDAFAGTLTLERVGGAREVLDDRGMWDVAVSPDGSRVAYCLGTLADPLLIVFDLHEGRSSLGRGAQPSWFPDGRTLAYAAPCAVQSDGYRSSFAQSELIVVDVTTGEVLSQTTTTDVVEMEPAVSPDGELIAVSDWSSGALYLIPVEQRSGTKSARVSPKLRPGTAREDCEFGDVSPVPLKKSARVLPKPQLGTAREDCEIGGISPVSLEKSHQPGREGR